MGLYDPKKDVGVEESSIGTRYTFRFLNGEKRMVKVKGGSRLFDLIIKACAGSPEPKTLKITAHGKAGDMTNRTYAVDVVR